MRKEIEQLINSNIPASTIERETGVSGSTITRIRKGNRKIENLTLEVAEKLYNYNKGVNNMKNYQEQYNQLQSKVESKESDHTVEFYRGHFLRFQNEGLCITIDFEKCTVESYAEINFMRYAEKETSFESMKDLYDILYFDYKQFFPTFSLASKTIVWIKQLFVDDKVYNYLVNNFEVVKNERYDNLTNLKVQSESYTIYYSIGKGEQGNFEIYNRKSGKLANGQCSVDNAKDAIEFLELYNR